MADLSAKQQAALTALLTRCSMAMLTQVDAMAAGLSGRKAVQLRQLAAEEVRHRNRRDRVLGPLDPLFKSRADGLPGLSFPASVRDRVWELATRHEPALLSQLDRGDRVSRMVADRLCLSAAMGVRDHPDQVWPEATPDQIETLAGCLDLVGIVRRYQGQIPDWLKGGTSSSSHDLKQAFAQAVEVSPSAPRRLLEILFAHTGEARSFLRLLTQLMPLTERSDSGLELADIHDFTRRLVGAVLERTAQVVGVDLMAHQPDLTQIGEPLGWAAEMLVELDAMTLVRPDAQASQALRQARQAVSHYLSDAFILAEQTVLSLLPHETSLLTGRMKRPVPRLDQRLKPAEVDLARILLAVVALSRGPALVFGREADRRQTAESLTWRLASWADEAIERVNADMVADVDLACECIRMTAELLSLIEATEAARSIRRRLAVIGSHREQGATATKGISPLTA